MGRNNTRTDSQRVDGTQGIQEEGMKFEKRNILKMKKVIVYKAVSMMSGKW